MEKGLRTSATKVLRSERKPQSNKKTKQLKPKLASKTALEKRPTKQNKKQKKRDTEIETVGEIQD